jgi:hypothetical protein
MKARVTLVFVIALLCSLAGLSCIDKPDLASPPGYDLNKPIVYNMPWGLHEISGIAFHHGQNNVLYAEEDEDGLVYYFHLGDKQVNNSRFGKHGDYEDIAIAGEQVVMLRSDGVFFTFPLKQVGKGKIKDVQKLDNVLPKGEYEGLYADDKSNVYALCKHCEIDRTSKTCSGYIFSLAANGTVRQTGQFRINVKQIEALIGTRKIDFHPSAIAKNTFTNEWYVVSSVNKILVITDANWKVKSVYHLNPALYVQPEGITFDSQRNLYISNEGADVNSGTVFKFNYNGK